ncbi:hypothetical protein E4T80_09840 [Muribacter muris]|uniref:Uncharacterized protein n=1 Tax=Muribacter muris TaxID=67855 RepID=A0A4Y9JS96_9PAST|nr:hypothetical protein [Muribacter muris]MBF0785759.1 hypothetical protein [Muribacter muris]MBF0828269.1 hypothetical protein [Muribacter muris]TFV08581.1 hypothetical protein E4T80_09840 [Muribacter muris]
MKQYHFLFKFIHEGQVHSCPIRAGSVREAKALAESIRADLHYANDYEEILEVQEAENKFDGQQIAWICARPVDELPFPFKQLKKAALLFAYGTDCQCCLGYRIMGGLLLGGIVGYLLG